MHPSRNRPTWMVWLSWLLLLALAVTGCATEPQPDHQTQGPQRIRSVPADAVFYLNDHQGSPVEVTNARGEVVRETTLHP
jgi:cytochrome oxidase Cu insertion factor (SCO1/SenC/PrrC family)